MHRWTPGSADLRLQAKNLHLHAVAEHHVNRWSDDLYSRRTHKRLIATHDPRRTNRIGLVMHLATPQLTPTLDKQQITFQQKVLKRIGLRGSEGIADLVTG